MIRVVVLGSGASVPSVGRNPVSIGIKYFGNVYLFDCGEGTQRQMMRFNLSYAKIKGIFITHLHADHVVGIIGLVQTLGLTGRKEPLYIFGPYGTKEYFENLLIITKRDFVVIKDIDKNFSFKGEGFKIRAFETEHSFGSVGYVFEEDERRNFDKSKAEELGIRGRMFKVLEERGEIEIRGKRIFLDEVSRVRKGKKIVYTGDTLPCKSVFEVSEGADLLIHDGTFGEELKEEAIEKKHSTVIDAVKVASMRGVKKLLLIHISGRYGDGNELVKQAKEIFENTEVAYDGMEILL